MKVYELALQIAFSERTQHWEASGKIEQFIRSALEEEKIKARGFESTARQLPERYSGYVFDQPFPLEEDKVYRPGKIYTVHLRIISEKKMEILSSKLPFYATEDIQGLSVEQGVIPEIPLFRVYSITPILFRGKQGYWRNQMSIREFEELLRKDLIQKYNFTHRYKTEGNFPIFENIRIENHKPITVSCDDRIFLGDKVSIVAAPNPQAQELLYMALGMGIGEANGKGYGFLGYRFFQEW